VSEPVLYALDKGVARIVLNRPGVRNALNSPTRRALLAALERARGEARVIVLTGAGGAFCAGQDLQEADADDAQRMAGFLAEEYEPILAAIREADQIVVAAVSGAAAGAGANLALGCDIVIAAESAVFLQGFSRIGLVPDAGGTWWLPRQIGMPRALGLALLGEALPARKAAEWGLIWECVGDVGFEAQVAARARALAEGPFRALAATKRALRQGQEAGLDVQLATEARLQAEALAGAEFREGVAAFLGKRKPAFPGEG
jgi:2-(1,2-epoxy-1,2-dihydrophenyl)acetyl-CoA isomerase